MADWELNLDEYMNDVNKKNLLGLDAEEPSLVKESDYEYAFNQPSAYAPAPLVSSGYEARRNDLMEQQARAESNAMDLLKQSLNKSAEVTPTQGFAAALLAAIPTLGGYMIGKSVGEPDLPPGYFEAGGTRAAAGLDKYQTGGAAGGLMGTQIGGKSAGIFLEGLDANQEQANKVRVAMAELEKQKGARLEGQLGSLENAAIAREDNQAFQRSMLEDRTMAAKELAGYRQEIKPEGFGASDIKDPAMQDAFAAISAGVGTVEQYKVLAQSPEALKQANQNARSAAYASSVANTQERFETTQGYSANQAAVSISPMGNDPKLNQKRAEIVGNRTMAKEASQRLAASYDATSGAFFGGDVKAEAAEAAAIFTAGRGLSGAGANLTANEYPLVAALSAPNMTVDGFVQFYSDFLRKGDPAIQTRIAASALDKAFNAKLSGYGQVFKEYANQYPAFTSSGPVQGLGDGGTANRKAELKAAIAAKKAELGVQ